MKRFFIYTLLFPPIALAVYLTPEQVHSREFPEPGYVIWLLGFAYAITIVPAYVTAAIDWALSSKAIYLRVIVAAALAAIMGILMARYLGQTGEPLYFGLIGAIPAAVCSWLSGRL